MGRKKSSLYGIRENNHEQMANSLFTIIAKNTYTGHFVVVEDYNDADDLGEAEEIVYDVKNNLTGRIKRFFNIEDAFDYKYNMAY